MKIVIFCDKRTGSTFLQDALGSHPDVLALDELFMIKTRAHKRRGTVLYKSKKKNNSWTPKKYINWVYKQGDNVVFKLIYDQAFRWDVLPALKENDVIILHLIRKNMLKKAVSRFTKNVYKIKKLDVSPDKLLEEVKKDIKKQKKAKKSLKGYKHVINLQYETMIGETVGEKNNIKKRGAFNIESDLITYMDTDVAKNLCKKLELKDVPLYCNLTKKNSNNVWEYIKNPKAVKKLFKESGFGDML